MTQRTISCRKGRKEPNFIPISVEVDAPALSCTIEPRYGRSETWPINHVIAHDDTIFSKLTDPKYAKADMWLARQIIGCVKTDSNSAKVFRLETSANLSLRSSGIRLLQDLRVRTKVTSTLREHAAEMRLQIYNVRDLDFRCR